MENTTDNSKTENFKSKCCGSDYYIGGDIGATNYHVCKKCGQPCDINFPAPSSATSGYEYLSDEALENAQAQIMSLRNKQQCLAGATWFRDTIHFPKMKQMEEEIEKLRRVPVEFVKWIITENWSWNGDMEWERKISGIWQYRTSEELYDEFQKFTEALK